MTVHSMRLKTLLELGIGGLLAVGWFVVRTLRRIGRDLVSSERLDNQALGTTTAAMIVCVVLMTCLHREAQPT